MFLLTTWKRKEKDCEKKAGRTVIVMETRHMFLAALDAPCLSPKQARNLEVNQAASEEAGRQAGRRLKFSCNVQHIAV